MTSLVPTFAFSFSKFKSFAGDGEARPGCERRYWLESIGSWGGWEPDAPPRARLLYRLSKMETLFGMAGKVTHRAIAAGLEDFEVDDERAVAGAHRRLQDAWRDSTGRRWAQPPVPWEGNPAKLYTNYAEHYYPDWESDPRGTSKRAWERAAAAIHRAYETPEFLEARESRILALEDLPKDPKGNGPRLVIRERCIGPGTGCEGIACACGGAGWKTEIPVWVMIDLAYEKGRPLPHDARDRQAIVVDWKSGRPRDADRVQILLYCLYAHDVWGYPLESIEGRLVYIGSDPVRTVPVVPVAESINALREMIPEAAGRIQDKLPDPALNQGPEEAFARTSDKSTCSTCTMFEGCWGHRDVSKPRRMP